MSASRSALQSLTVILTGGRVDPLNLIILEVAGARDELNSTLSGSAHRFLGLGSVHRFHLRLMMSIPFGDVAAAG